MSKLQISGNFFKTLKFVKRFNLIQKVRILKKLNKLHVLVNFFGSIFLLNFNHIRHRHTFFLIPEICMIFFLLPPPNSRKKEQNHLLISSSRNVKKKVDCAIGMPNRNTIFWMRWKELHGSFMLSCVSDGTTMIMIMKSEERGWKVDLEVRQKVIVTTVLLLIFDSSSFAPNFDKFHLDFLINQHHRCAT